MPSRKQMQAHTVSEMGIPHLMISEETILEIKATVTVVREENEQLRQRIADLEVALSRAQCVPDNRPRPDWSTAPDWANFWAVDAAGEAHWYDGNPLVFMTLRWGFYEGNKYNRSYAGYVVLPLGCDWRTMKEQRQ